MLDTKPNKPSPLTYQTKPKCLVPSQTSLSKASFYKNT